MSDLRPIFFQVGIFLEPFYSGDFNELALEIKTKFGETDRVLVLPEGIPDELHRLRVEYDSHSIRVAKSRIDILVRNKEQIAGYFENIRALLESKKINIHRLGFIANYVKPVADVTSLKPLLHPSLDGNFTEFLLRLNFVDQESGLPINNVENAAYGIVEEDDGGKKTQTQGVLLTRDVNTLPRSLTDKDPEYLRQLLTALSVRSETSRMMALLQ